MTEQKTVLTPECGHHCGMKDNHIGHCKCCHPKILASSCICPRFKDILPTRISDLSCPIHGVNGTNPGDWREE